MVSKNSSPFKTAIRQEIKQFRSDARKLDAIANHLRSRAKYLAGQLKADERAEKERANFFSKPAKIDPSIPLTPDMPAECPHKTIRSWPDCYEDCDYAGKPECPHTKDGANKNPLKWD